jgi:hypothetical protein
LNLNGGTSAAILLGLGAGLVLVPGLVIAGYPGDLVFKPAFFEALAAADARRRARFALIDDRLGLSGFRVSGSGALPSLSATRSADVCSGSHRNK